MDFYEVSSREMTKLSRTEQSIVKYVIKNMAETAQMSIRELSEKCFVSPATLFRFTKRLGYEGYADFQKALSDTVKSTSAVTIPGIMSSERYRDDYLNNVLEAVKVITDDKMRRFKEIIEKRPRIYLIAKGLSEDVARYFYRLLGSLEFDVFLPIQEHEIRSMIRNISSEDLLLVFSYNGNNESVIHIMERVLTYGTPSIISITRADNNTIQNMSTLNFYVFADEIRYMDTDLTSRCGMIAILETLLYRFISEQQK